MFTEALKERDSLNAAGIPPQSLNGTANSTAVDMSLFNRVQFLVYTGVGAFSVNAALQQGNNANGSDAAAITNGAAASVNSANAGFTLEIASNQLTGRYVRVQLVTIGAVLVAAVPVATEPRYHPANSYDAAFVNQRFQAVP